MRTSNNNKTQIKIFFSFQNYKHIFIFFFEIEFMEKLKTCKTNQGGEGGRTEIM